VKAALVLVALTTAAAAQPRVFVSPELAKQLKSGSPVDVELVANGQPLGTCRVTYNIWEEVYRVDDRVVAADPLQACVDPARTMSALAKALAAHRPFIIIPKATRPRDPWISRSSNGIWCGGLPDLPRR
jgi:hypothetical protein